MRAEVQARRAEDRAGEAPDSTRAADRARRGNAAGAGAGGVRRGPGSGAAGGLRGRTAAPPAAIAASCGRVDPDGKLDIVPVKVGITDGQFTEVAGPKVAEDSRPSPR